jgi:hypothetical protein
MVKLRARFRPFTFIALALIAASALSCDFFALALPQGAANATYAYADPRIEKSVRVKDLDEPFGLALAPDGRSFVIARNGVNEYDAELTLVRSYLADPAQGIDKRDSEKGPEEWQITTGPGATTCLVGTRSGTVLYLFASGGTILQKKYSESDLYSLLHNPINFEEIPYLHTLGGTALITNVSPNTPLSLSFDSATLTLDLLVSTSSVFEDNGKIRYGLSFGSLNPYDAPTTFTASANFTPPSISSEFTFQRLYARGSIVAVALGRGSYIGDIDGITLVFDRFLGGAPLASFAMKSSVSAATDSHLFQLSAERQENAWLHKLRWLP